MFNIDQAVDAWRARLLNGGDCQAADAEELETHLRAAVDELIETGLDEEEAFLVATHRLGHVSSLADEFSKVNSLFVWRQRLLWLMGGYILITVLHQLMSVLSHGGVILGSAGGIGAERGGSAVSIASPHEQR